MLGAEALSRRSEKPSSGAEGRNRGARPKPRSKFMATLFGMIKSDAKLLCSDAQPPPRLAHPLRSGVDQVQTKFLWSKTRQWLAGYAGDPGLARRLRSELSSGGPVAQGLSRENPLPLVQGLFAAFEQALRETKEALREELEGRSLEASRESRAPRDRLESPAAQTLKKPGREFQTADQKQRTRVRDRTRSKSFFYGWNRGLGSLADPCPGPADSLPLECAGRSPSPRVQSLKLRQSRTSELGLPTESANGAHVYKNYYFRKRPCSDLACSKPGNSDCSAPPRNEAPPNRAVGPNLAHGDRKPRLAVRAGPMAKPPVLDKQAGPNLKPGASGKLQSGKGLRPARAQRSRKSCFVKASGPFFGMLGGLPQPRLVPSRSLVQTGAGLLWGEEEDSGGGPQKTQSDLMEWLSETESRESHASGAEKAPGDGLAGGRLSG